MLNTETLLESSTGISKSNSSRIHKLSLKQQLSAASSISSSKTTPLLSSNSQSASASKKKGIFSKTSQSKISPRSGSSSLTSEIPCFDLNSCYDVGSSTSASTNHNNNQLISLKSPSSCQKPMIDFSPVLQPCEDPLTQFQFSHSQSLFPGKSTEELTRIDQTPRLIHWNLLPAEIQKAVIDLDGQVDELQHRFREYVPIIEPHLDSSIALSKVIEAQRFQERQVYKLTNQKEGVSLQSAVNNIIKGFEQGNISSSNSEKNMHSLAKKSKKIRKYSSGKTTASSLRTQQREGNSDFDEKNYSSPKDKESVSKTLAGIKFSSVQDNTMHQSALLRADPREIPGQFQGNHHIQFQQQQESQQQFIPFKANNTFNAMSPRKAVYDDEIMNQSELNGAQHQMNNQHEDFCGLTKLRRYLSDPFGYSYFNQQNYINSMPSNPHHNRINTHTDELEGELQMVYQEESIFDGILHHQQQNGEDHQQLQQPAPMESFKKDDEDDTLNGAYHSQNDTYEELINSQSKCCSQNGYQAKVHENICCQSAPNIPTISQSNNFSFLNDSSPCHQQQNNLIRSFLAAPHSYPTDFYSHKPLIHKEFDFPQETSDNMFGGIL